MPKSQSTSVVRRPWRCSSTASDVARNDLPVPPLPLAIATVAASLRVAGAPRKPSNNLPSRPRPRGPSPLRAVFACRSAAAFDLVTIAF